MLCLAGMIAAQAQDRPGATSAQAARKSELARLEQRQPALLQAEAAVLAPHRKGETNIYAIGIAGWATLDVFAKEVDGGLTAIGRVLPIKDRMIRLINHPATVGVCAAGNASKFPGCRA